jgi:hypothetical protein
LSNTLAQVQALVANGQIRLSLHGFREMAADGIMLDDLLGNLTVPIRCYGRQIS